MKRSLTCPKCQSTDLLYIEHVADHEENGFFEARLALTKRPWVIGQVVEAHGKLEAYACQGCGYIEYYLTEGIPVDGVSIRAVKGPR